jgi:hypothetical protein
MDEIFLNNDQYIDEENKVNAQSIIIKNENTMI